MHFFFSFLQPRTTLWRWRGVLLHSVGPTGSSTVASRVRRQREEESGWGRRKMWMPKRTARSASVCRLLFLKLKAQNEREKFAFCSVKGCERIKIKALIPKNAGISDCTATAYPKFTEKAIVDVPMPKKLFGSLLVSGRQPAEPQAP